MTLDYLYDLKYLLDVDTTGGGGYKARYVYNYGLTGNTSYNGQNSSADYRWLMDMNLETTPDTDKKGSTVKFSGNASTSGVTAGTGVGAMSFSGSLHYSRACSGIDSGSVTYTSGVNTVTYTYTGCNTVGVK